MKPPPRAVCSQQAKRGIGWIEMRARETDYKTVDARSRNAGSEPAGTEPADIVTVSKAGSITDRRLLTSGARPLVAKSPLDEHRDVESEKPGMSL
jgi:hypothetical protein